MIHISLERRYDAAYTERPAAGDPDYSFTAPGAGSRAITVAVVPLGATTWTAEFAAPDPGMRALSGLFSTPSPDRLCVIERGTAFFGDVRVPEGFAAVHTLGPVVDISDAVSSELLLLLTPWAVTALNSHGPQWTSERIANEAFRIVDVSDGWVRGFADPSDEPRGFAVELATGLVVGGAGQT